MNETGQLNRVDHQPLVRLPNVALTIKQPWAELIVQGFKDIENRSWPTKFRGWVLIHASKRDDQDEWDSARSLIQWRKIPIGRSSEKVGRGGVVGVARIVDCVSESSSPWFVGDFGFVLADARPLPFFACRGALGFWKCEYPEALLSETTIEAMHADSLQSELDKDAPGVACASLLCFGVPCDLQTWLDSPERVMRHVRDGITARELNRRRWGSYVPINVDVEQLKACARHGLVRCVKGKWFILHNADAMASPPLTPQDTDHE